MENIYTESKFNVEDFLGGLVHNNHRENINPLLQSLFIDHDIIFYF